MRGIETPITKIRRQVFTEVAKIAFESIISRMILKRSLIRSHRPMCRCTVTVFSANVRLGENVSGLRWVCRFGRRASLYISRVV